MNRIVQFNVFLTDTQGIFMEDVSLSHIHITSEICFEMRKTEEMTKV